MNSNNYIVRGLGTQVTQVGYEFSADMESDAEIYRLMGFQAGVFGGRLLCNVGLEWHERDGFHNNATRCIAELEDIGIGIFFLSTVDARKRKPKNNPFVQEYIAVFEKDETLYATVPFPSEDQAAACALWYVLSVSHD
jgi:hypothetical protein